MSNFDTNPFTCGLTLLPGKSSPNIANKKHVFPEKGRGDRALILTYLDSPMAEVFPHYCLSFSILVIFREKLVVKIGLKVQTLDLFFLWKLESFNFFSNNVFCLLEYWLWWEFRQYWTIFGGVRAQNRLIKGLFMDTESVRKTLKTFNLTNHKRYSDETYHDYVSSWECKSKTS